MARKAHSRITRTVTRWSAEVADNSEIEVSVWHQHGNVTAEIRYYGVETGWHQNEIVISDETAVALAVSLIKGKDTAGLLADRVEELEKDTYERETANFAHHLRRGNLVEVAEAKKTAARQKAKAKRDAMKDAMESVGLKKVRGAMGGTYWE